MNFKFAICAIALLVLMVVGASAATIPATIKSVKINDITVTPTSVNALNLKRGEIFDLQVVFNSPQDLANVELEASIAGYEFNSNKDEQLTARASIEDLSANVDYTKNFKLQLPEDLESDSYLLTLRLMDRNDDTLTQAYKLQISSQRKDMQIKDVSFQPNTQAQAGTAVFAKIRLENKGQLDEKDVKVELQFPELGLSDSAWIDMIRKDTQKDSEELYVKLPRCAEPGVYQANVAVTYNKGRSTVTSTGAYHITENADCKPASTVQVVVEPAEPAQDSIDFRTIARRALESVLLILVVLLVVIGLILGVTRIRTAL